MVASCLLQNNDEQYIVDFVEKTLKADKRKTFKTVKNVLEKLELNI
jgi:hypothetical protein